MGQSLIELARVERLRGDLDRSQQLLEEARGLFQEVGYTHGTAWVLGELASVAREKHDNLHATRLQQDSLRLNRQTGDALGITICLNVLAGLALGRGKPELAARLLGAASKLTEVGGFIPSEGADPTRTLATARARLGEAAFERHWAAGRTLSRDQAIEEALAEDPHARPTPAGQPSGLTARELEVLRLVATGRSNQEIGNELVLSVRTVERHITNLYAKIGARGRAEATAYAFQHGLM
jgi:ATP/maltotriose-dependent transcriptional regulator MalT